MDETRLNLIKEFLGAGGWTDDTEYRLTQHISGMVEVFLPDEDSNHGGLLFFEKDFTIPVRLLGDQITQQIDEQNKESKEIWNRSTEAILKAWPTQEDLTFNISAAWPTEQDLQDMARETEWEK